MQCSTRFCFRLLLLRLVYILCASSLALFAPPETRAERMNACRQRRPRNQNCAPEALLLIRLFSRAFATRCSAFRARDMLISIK